MGYGMVGEYLGFCFNNYHSSWFGITRTSSGDRYNQDLLPTVKDQTQEVPGMEGMLYFGQTWSKREFQVPFAFDNMSEGQYVALTAWLNEPNIKPLFFDETPHKVYSAKVTGKVTAKVMIFDDETGERVYKGDGSITFTCYFPFARGNSGTISVNNTFGDLIKPRRITYKAEGRDQPICALRESTPVVTDETAESPGEEAGGTGATSSSEDVVIIPSNTYRAMISDAAKAPAPVYCTHTLRVDGGRTQINFGTDEKPMMVDFTDKNLPNGTYIIDGYQCLIYKDDNIYNHLITNGDFFWGEPGTGNIDTLYY